MKMPLSRDPSLHKCRNVCNDRTCFEKHVSYFLSEPKHFLRDHLIKAKRKHSLACQGTANINKCTSPVVVASAAECLQSGAAVSQAARFAEQTARFAITRLHPFAPHRNLHESIEGEKPISHQILRHNTWKMINNGIPRSYQGHAIQRVLGFDQIAELFAIDQIGFVAGRICYCLLRHHRVFFQSGRFRDAHATTAPLSLARRARAMHRKRYES